MKDRVPPEEEEATATCTISAMLRLEHELCTQLLQKVDEAAELS